MKASVKSKPAFQTATLFAGVVLLMIVFVSVGYFFTIVDAPPPEDPAAIDVATREAQWVQNQPARYRFTVERECYCPPEYRKPFTVTVENGLRSFSYSRTFEQSTTGATPAPPEPVAVDDLFRLLHNAARYADSLSVSFHSEFGYPEIIRVDWSDHRADDEQAFIIRDFQALP